MSTANRKKNRKPKCPFPDFGTKQTRLEYELTEILSRYCGERIGDFTPSTGEGAVDTLCRIIAERDAALQILALDRIRPLRLGVFASLR